MKECNQCGKCCTKYSDGGLSASTSEIELWEIYRPDIYRFVKGGKIWISPETAEPLSLCPFLTKLPGEQKYICDIYYDRPDDCKFYPVSIEQMINDECEMLQRHDLENPARAQKDLDRIMADSRPPFK